MQASATFDARPSPMIGQTLLIRAAFEGSDMAACADTILSRFGTDNLEAGAAMDLSTILLLMHRPDEALQLQAEVLEHTRYFALQSNKSDAKVRVLVLFTAGDLMANTPVGFLLNDKKFSVEYLFVLPEEEFPHNLPEHDVIIVGVAYSSVNERLLETLSNVADRWTRPVINHPRNVLRTSRHGIAEALGNSEHILAPRVVRIKRSELVASECELPNELAFPIIIRPIDTHAGQELQKIEATDFLRKYVDDSPAEEFYITKFYDYSNSDGLFRKLRVALIDGRPFLCHMALRDHWMIHYLNAGMLESPEKRNAEAQAMAEFQTEFVLRHQKAFADIQQHIGLDYLTIDCSESKDGRLLIFEADTGMIVHDMDPPDLFPYKNREMQKVFCAFHNAIEARLR